MPCRAEVADRDVQDSLTSAFISKYTGYRDSSVSGRVSDVYTYSKRFTLVPAVDTTRITYNVFPRCPLRLDTCRFTVIEGALKAVRVKKRHFIIHFYIQQ